MFGIFCAAALGVYVWLAVRADRRLDKMAAGLPGQRPPVPEETAAGDD